MIKKKEVERAISQAKEKAREDLAEIVALSSQAAPETKKRVADHIGNVLESKHRKKGTDGSDGR